MNLGKSENSYLKKFHTKKDISNLKPVNKKEKHITYDHLKDWDELNYEKENNKIILNNSHTSIVRQTDTNVKNENNHLPHCVYRKQDSPNDFSINTSMFTNKYNELTDKIDLSQMTTSYQLNINQNKDNLPLTQVEVDKLNGCNSYKNKQYNAIEEKEEFKLNKSTSKGNKLIEIDGNFIITDRSIMDEFDSLYLDDSLNDIDDKFNKEKSQPSFLKELNYNTNGIKTNKDVNLQNKIDHGMNRIILNPIINHSQNYTGAKFNEISDGNNQKKNRISSPYIRRIPSQYGIIESECKNSDSYVISSANNDSTVMHYPPNPLAESVIKHSIQANSLYYYSNNLLNQNINSFHMNMNIAPHPIISNEAYNSVNTSNLHKSSSTNNTLNKKEHNMLILNTNRSDTKNISINNFKKSYICNKDKKEYNSIMSYRPYSCIDTKTKFKAVTLKPLEGVRYNKESESNKDKANTEKVKATLRTQFNMERRNDDLKVDLISVSALISPKSKANQDKSCNQTAAKNNGYSHIHSIKRLKLGKNHDDTVIDNSSNVSEIKSESRHNNSLMRPKSSGRLKPLTIDKIKNTQKMFSKVYTTLHENKTRKNTNDTHADNTNTDSSSIVCPSKLGNIRPNSSRPNIRIKNDKDYILTKENSIETLLEKNKILNEKVEKIKNYFNSKKCK